MNNFCLVKFSKFEQIIDNNTVEPKKMSNISWHDKGCSPFFSLFFLSVEENAFLFDGKKTYVDIPENVLPEDIGDKFTISTWIKTAVAKGRQTIITSTDKERLDRVHFSLSISGTKLLFVHRPEANHASRDLYCKTDFQYKPAIFDSEWHHILVVAAGCDAKLYIDGKHHTPVVTESDWTLHKSKLKIKLTVGARYLAKEKIYTENFSGYLSGLAIRPNNSLNEQVKDVFIAFSCVYSYSQMGCSFVGSSAMLQHSVSILTVCLMQLKFA